MPAAAVTFDLGDTLIGSGQSFSARLRRLHRWLTEHDIVISLGRVEAALKAAAETQTLAWRWGHQGSVQSFAREVMLRLRLRPPADDRLELQQLLEDPDPDLTLTASPGAGEALEQLRGAGLRLGIVCDALLPPGRVIRRQLRAIGLLEFFEPQAIAFSDEVGVPKPDPELFLTALRQLEVPPELAAHVGDLKLFDVAGARRTGMRAIRYTGCRNDPAPGPEADVVLGDLAALPAALASARS